MDRPINEATPLTENKKGRKNRKVCLILLGCLCIVAICTAIVLGVYFGCVSPLFCPNNRSHEPKNLGDVLPTSFAAHFRVYDLNEHVQASIIWLEWDRKNKQRRYQETQFDTEYSLLFQSNITNSVMVTITIADGEGVMAYTINNQYNTRCFRETKDISSYYLIQLAEVATLSSKNDDACPGRVWSIRKCKMDIQYCEDNSTLLYIKEEKRIHRVVDWETPTSHSIRLPKHNHTCKITMEEIAKIISTDDDNDDDGTPDLISPLTSERSRTSKKLCLFIHGVGQDSPKEGYETKNSFKKYWGDVQNYVTNKCYKSQFIKFDTSHHGWDDSSLHQSFCRFAGGIQYTVKDTIVFGHSMGNLIIAAALHKRVCSFDSSTTEWYAVQAPWKGSKSADRLDIVCKLNISRYVPFCAGNKPVPAYKTLQTNYRSPTGITFADLIMTAQNYVNGSLCGDDEWGVGKNLIHSILLEKISDYTRLEKPSDGVVSYQKSCDVWGSFKETYRSKFYKGKINHFEGPCRYGDIDWCPFWWKEEKSKPCSWYSEV